MTWMKYLLRVVWLIGLLLLSLVYFHYAQVVKGIESKTFNVSPLLWFYAYAPLLMGAYFGLLFVKGKSPKLGDPLLLCVCLPCILFTLYPPVFSTITLSMGGNLAYFPTEIVRITNTGIVPFIAGTTLVAGLFGENKRRGAYARSIC